MSEVLPTVANNEPDSRYEISLGVGLAGFAAYRLDGQVISFFHTEVDPAFEGQGLGSVLAKAALDDVRARGLKVVPECPFFKVYMKRHDECADLLA